MLTPILLVTLAACAPIRPEEGKSPLIPVQMSPDSSALDIFFVNFPFGDEEANDLLWQEVDEQHFPAEVRQRLWQNGFRAGLTGGQVPPKLAELLQLENKPTPNGQANRIDLEDLEPKVSRRHLQLPPGRRSEIVTSGVYEELPVLVCNPDGVCGGSYPKAQGLLAIKAFPQPDGRVRLELVPELHYGESRQRIVGQQGAFRLETNRRRRTFDTNDCDLTLTATLAAGNMLIASCLPGRSGSLGQHFFSHDVSGQQQQKLLVIRLSQTQHDDLFAPHEVLPLDDVLPPAEDDVLPPEESE